MLTGILRKYQGDLTQNEFARLLGLSSAGISLIYTGQRGVGVDVLRAFLKQFPEAAPEIAKALAAPERQPEKVSA